MIAIRVAGRRLVPARAVLGLTLDRAAETVRFAVAPPRAEVFDTPGMRATVQWIAPGGESGRSALTLRPSGGALTGDWSPPPEALLRKGALRAELRCSVADEVVWHSLPLALILKKSLEHERIDRVAVPDYKAVTVDVTPLPAGSEPVAAVRQTAERIDFYFGIPALRGLPGDPGRGVPAGGSDGQALVKKGDADCAAAWRTLTADDIDAGGGVPLSRALDGLRRELFDLRKKTKAAAKGRPS